MRSREVANSGGDEVGEKFISLIKINLDVAQSTLAAIEVLTSSQDNVKEKEVIILINYDIFFEAVSYCFDM